MKQNDSLLNKNVILVFFVTFIFFATLDMTVYPLPLYVLELGGGPREIGYIAGTFSFSAILFRPLLGRISDARGNKGILIIGMIASATAPLLYLAFSDLRLVALVRAYHGLGLAAVVLATQAMMAGLAPSGKKGQAVALQGIADGSGLMLGPPLGQWMMEAQGFHQLFISIAVLAGIGFFLALLTDEPRNNIGDVKVTEQEITGPFLQPQLLLATLLGFAVAFVFGSVLTFLPVYAEQLTVQFKSGLFVILALFAIIGRYTTGLLSDKYGRNKVVLPAVVLIASGAMLLAFWTASFGIYLATALVGLGFGSGHCGLLTIAAEGSSSQFKGRSISLYATVFDLGIAASSYIFGVIAEWSSYGTVFTAAGLLGLALGLPLYIRLIRLPLCS